MNICVRVDASTGIGTGHMMRCLALAQAWQDGGGHTVFVMTTEVPALNARLQSEGMGIVHLPVQSGSTEDAIQTANQAQNIGASWVVADGYDFGADYQRIIEGSGAHLLFIDDGGYADHYHADIILNQNLHAEEGLYVHREPYTRLLLGTKYVLIRQEFLKWRGWRRDIPAVARKVLVTLGGGDLNNATLKVIQALQQIKMEGLEVVVVAGGSNPHHEELQTAVNESQFAIRLAVNVSDMSELMAWSDAAISAGGTTVWELAFMGVPSIVGVIAPIEEVLVGGLRQEGLFLHLGWLDQVSVDQLVETLSSYLSDKRLREHMSLLGRQIVDGAGCSRVLEAMLG